MPSALIRVRSPSAWYGFIGPPYSPLRQRPLRRVYAAELIAHRVPGRDALVDAVVSGELTLCHVLSRAQHPRQPGSLVFLEKDATGLFRLHPAATGASEWILTWRGLN